MDAIKLTGQARSRGKMNEITLSGVNGGAGDGFRTLAIRYPEYGSTVTLAILSDATHYLAIETHTMNAVQYLDDNALLAMKEQIDGYFERKQAADAGWLDSKNLNALAAGD